jgi:activator of HSP90 ATPase
MAAKKKKKQKKQAAKKKPAPAKKKAAAKKKPVKKATKKQPAKRKASKKQAKASAPTRVANVDKVAKIGPKPTTTIVQHVFLQATPEQVFDALVQPALASSILGGEASGEPSVGGAFTHWNGYSKGKHLELVRGERIVQEWSTTEWPKGAPPSRLEILLLGASGGTELTMTHSGVPSEQAEDYRQGWIDYYWTPLRAHFG